MIDTAGTNGQAAHAAHACTMIVAVNVDSAWHCIADPFASLLSLQGVLRHYSRTVAVGAPASSRAADSFRKVRELAQRHIAFRSIINVRCTRRTRMHLLILIVLWLIAFPVAEAADVPTTARSSIRCQARHSYSRCGTQREGAVTRQSDLHSGCSSAQRNSSCGSRMKADFNYSRATRFAPSLVSWAPNYESEIGKAPRDSTS